MVESAPRGNRGAFFYGEVKRMIRLVEKEPERRKLLELCEKTPFGCKISSVATSYGFDKSFACFWLDEETDVVFCLVDGVMLLSGTVLDGEPVRLFLQAVGAKGVLCAVRNAEALGLSGGQSGDVLKRFLLPGESAPPPPPVNIRKIYSLLEKTGMVEEFEPFYLDLSHKLRHGGALALAVEGVEGLAACAVVSSVCRTGAILSALAVAEGCRRQGLGSALARDVEAYFPGRTLYVFREKDKHREFYKNLGYVKADTWVYATL